MEHPVASADSLDLSRCEDEPIHIPGAIQPHGILLGLDDYLIVEHSAGPTGAYLDIDPETLVGSELASLFEHDQIARLVEGFEYPDPREANPVRLRSRDDRLFDGLLSRSGDVNVLELEEAASHDPGTLFRFHGYVVSALERLSLIDDLGTLQEAVARQVRHLTGFDRVMVYQFDADWHGEVVAEARIDGIEPFLGLRYPASDIPAQARRLYMQNWVRVIPDIEYDPAPIVPAVNARSGRPLDLSQSQLRSVSPVHVQYLRNMGVSATMTISLVKESELWGLIACHHMSPKLVSFELRLACELLGQALSSRVRLLGERRLRERSVQAGAFLSEVVEDLLQFDHWTDPLLHRSRELMEMVRASGLAIVDGAQIERRGDALSDAAVRSLVSGLAGFRTDDHPIAIDALEKHAPELAPGPDVAGVLAVPVSKPDGRWIMWFRPEQRREVNWGGDPRKPVALGPADRLSPRGSFELWSEEVRDTSAPWDAVDEEAAAQLRLRVANAILTRVEATARSRREVDRVSRELEDLLLGASHDLRAPVRGIRLYSQILLEDHAASLSGESKELVESMLKQTDRMDRLIESLLYYSRVGRVEMQLARIDLIEIARDVLELLAAVLPEDATITVDESLPTVRADRERVFEVYLNLLDNAIKYAGSAPLVIHVGVQHADPPVLYVQDNGIGVPERYQREIFRVFRRLHGPGEFGGGSGAGLTVVQKVVALHGGKVWVESEPGHGSTFFFTLLPDTETSPT